MRPALFITLLFVLCGSIGYAQNEAITDITDITKVTVLSPGIGYEKRIGKFQSLYLQGFFNIIAGLGYSSSQGFLSQFYLDPALSLEYRYYYNYRRRQERGKRTAMNSLNYIAPFFRTIFEKGEYFNAMGDIVEKRKPVHALGATIGMQRNFKSRFSLDMNIGVGYTIVPKSTNPAPSLRNYNNSLYIPIRISFGIWLNKRK
jgi:hypothetical protein